MLTRLMLARPRLALIIALIIITSGLLSLQQLPLTEYPDITPAKIEVKAFYPGASASVVERSVATPLEEAINGVKGMLYMTSTSASDGTMNLQVYFQVGTDRDQAEQRVQSRLERARQQLPREVLLSGLTAQKSLSSQLAFITFYSPQGSLDTTFIANYVKLNITDELRRLPELGDVFTLGRKDYSMRIWLQPEHMARASVSVADIQAAVRAQNADLASGHIGQAPTPASQRLEYIIESNGRLSSVEQFEQIVLRTTANGNPVRLRDVARIELAAETFGTIENVDGQQSSNLMVYLEPGANAIQASRSMHQTLERLSNDFPEDLSYLIPYDISQFVTETLEELSLSLLMAMALVVLVIVVFLKEWRASLIPAVTIPISLVGTFAILLLMDYSLNIITLFGLILAVGIVVDDAIVVTENVQRHLHNGLARRHAVIAAMKEVTGPVVATTMVLLAVFIPSGFIAGTTGHFYQQFAVATSAAVVISSICALTLSPVMCALLLKPDQHPKQDINPLLTRVTTPYMQAVSWLSQRTILLLVIFLAMVIACSWLFKTLPKTFVPNEDRGFFYLLVTLPDNASLNRTQETVEELSQTLKQLPEIAHTVSVTGLDVVSLSQSSPSAMMVVILTPWKQRPDENQSLPAVIQQSLQAIGERQDAVIIPVPPSSIPALSYLGGFEYRLLDKTGHSHEQMGETVNTLVAAARAQPSVGVLFSGFSSHHPHIHLTINRDKARALGVNISDISTRLQAHFGSLHIDTFLLHGRNFPVIIQGDHGFRQDTTALSRVFVGNSTGEQVPLSVLVEEQPYFGPVTINHYNMMRSATLNGQQAPGYSLKAAMAAMEQLDSQLPPGFSRAWSGVSREEASSGNQLLLVVLLALFIAWLFLVVQYESLLLPLAVLASVPVGLIGALGGLWLWGQDNTIYAQLSMILLVGLSAKNAILIVEFADSLRQQGLPLMEAALTATRLRFRAVLMTALSFILGVIPLLLASGAGANGRYSLGLSVFCGMITVALFSTLLTPGFYLIVQSIRERFGHSRKPAA